MLNGYYDLATPFFATRKHDGAPRRPQKEQQARIQMKYYEAGHMMYVHETSLKQMKSAIAAFYDATGGRGRGK